MIQVFSNGMKTPGFNLFTAFLGAGLSKQGQEKQGSSEAQRLPQLLGLLMQLGPGAFTIFDHAECMETGSKGWWDLEGPSGTLECLRHLWLSLVKPLLLPLPASASQTEWLSLWLCFQDYALYKSCTTTYLLYIHFSKSKSCSLFYSNCEQCISETGGSVSEQLAKRCFSSTFC